MAAWDRGARIEHWRAGARLRPEIIHLADACVAPPTAVRAGRLVREQLAGGVCVRVYEPAP